MSDAVLGLIFGATVAKTAVVITILLGNWLAAVLPNKGASPVRVAYVARDSASRRRVVSVTTVARFCLLAVASLSRVGGKETVALEEGITKPVETKPIAELIDWGVMDKTWQY